MNITVPGVPCYAAASVDELCVNNVDVINETMHDVKGGSPWQWVGREGCKSDEECLLNGRSVCDDDPHCLGIAWYTNRVDEPLKICRSKAMGPKIDGWRTFMKQGIYTVT